MDIRIKKVHESSKMPVRAHATDAGMDLFYCPEEPKTVWVAPGQNLLLGTGLQIEVPEGYMLEIKNKGGIAAKQNLLVGACVVDRGFTGEIFVDIHNVGERTKAFSPGDKIAQGVFVKVEYNTNFIQSGAIYDEDTTRGSGSLGSTGTK